MKIPLAPLAPCVRSPHMWEPCHSSLEQPERGGHNTNKCWVNGISMADGRRQYKQQWIDTICYRHYGYHHGFAMANINMADIVYST